MLWKRVLIYLCFLSPLQATAHAVSADASAIVSIKTAMKAWEHDAKSLPAEELPELRQEHSYHYARAYYRFYRGVGLFLNSQRPKLSASSRLGLLSKAKEALESADDCPCDVVAWKQHVMIAQAHAYFAQKSYHDVIDQLAALQASGHKQLDDDLVVLFAESLRASSQGLDLKRLLLAHASLFERLTSGSSRLRDAKQWQQLLQDAREEAKLHLPAKKVKTSADQGHLEAGDDGKPAPPSWIIPQRELTIQGSLLERWRRWRASIDQRYFANHDTRFDEFLQEYSAGLTSPKRSPVQVKYMRLFDQGLKVLPPELLRKYIKRMWDKQQLVLAIKASELFLKKFPGHPDYPTVSYDKGRLLEDAGKYVQAYNTFMQSATYLMGTKHEEAYLFRRAWVAYLARSFGKARQHFGEYLGAYPSGSFASTVQYYHLRSLAEQAKSLRLSRESLKQNALDFVKRYPLNYYSVKLVEEYKLSPQLMLAALQTSHESIDEFVEDNPLFKLGSEGHYWLGLYRELKALGLKDEAFMALSRLDQKMGDQPQWIAYVIDEAKDQEEAHLLTRQAMKVMQGIPALRPYVNWQDLYPRFRENEIKRQLAESKSNLPYELVVSLIRQESAFNEHALSRVKARGLMQIMPATAKLVNKELKMDHYDLLEANDNLKFGIHILKRLADKYAGRYDYMLSAYNAGDTVTDRWIALRGKLAQDEFIESIPYGETRDYVKYILRNMAFYRLLDPSDADTAS